MSLPNTTVLLPKFIPATIPQSERPPSDNRSCNSSKKMNQSSTGHPATTNRWHTTRYVRWFVIPALLILVIFDIVVLAAHYRETRQVAELANKLTVGQALPSEKTRSLTRHLLQEVPNGRPDHYFLSPVFRPLKPTALQVLQHGGDCAYKARALIVMLHELQIPASKLALHDDRGHPVHAVVQVETERGPMIVDALYGIVYDDQEGAPIPLADLEKNESVLRDALEIEISQGNDRAARYPVEKYGYQDVKTINWQKSAPWKIAHRLLSMVYASETIDNFPRPYLAEVPAFMVLVASFGAKAALLMSVVILILARRRAVRKHRPVGDAAAKS